MGRERVLRAIAQIERQKRAAGIVPSYATMRELHARLSTAETAACALMVRQGILEQHENINGPMYGVAAAAAKE